MEEGTIVVGDTVAVLDRPGHGVTVGMVMRAQYGEHDLAPALLAAPQLPGSVRRWATARAADRA